MVIEHGLLRAQVVHSRNLPRENRFRYSVYYLSFPLSRMAEIAQSKLCGVNKAHLMSYHEKDHGDASMSNEPWARGILKEWGLDAVCDGEITVVAMPRILGYQFNPVSFWFCCDAAGALRCVLSEVHNTFGEAHIYVSYHEDHRPITGDDWMESVKLFHVSPFMRIDGKYRYRFIFSDAKIAVWITYEQNDGVVLHTSLIGTRHPLNARNLAYCLVRYPLVTFKVVGLIHWQALKLTLKGVRYHRKPPQNTIRHSR
jgi:uncharacterized protein